MASVEVSEYEYQLAEKIFVNSLRMFSRMTITNEPDGAAEYSDAGALGVFVLGPVAKMLAVITPPEHRHASAALLRTLADLCEAPTPEAMVAVHQRAAEACNAYSRLVPKFAYEVFEGDDEPKADAPTKQEAAADPPPPPVELHTTEHLAAERVFDAALNVMPVPHAVGIAMFLSCVSKRFWRELPEDQKKLASAVLAAHAEFAAAPFVEMPDANFSAYSAKIVSTTNAFLAASPTFAERSQLTPQ